MNLVQGVGTKKELAILEVCEFSKNKIFSLKNVCYFPKIYNCDLNSSLYLCYLLVSIELCKICKNFVHSGLEIAQKAPFLAKKIKKCVFITL